MIHLSLSDKIINSWRDISVENLNREDGLKLMIDELEKLPYQRHYSICLPCLWKIWIFPTTLRNEYYWWSKCLKDYITIYTKIWNDTSISLMCAEKC